MAAKIEITKDAILMPGDTIELHYTVLGPAWLKAVQLEMIESRLEKDPRFYMYSQKWTGEKGNRLIITVQVIKPPAAAGQEAQQAGVPVATLLIVVGSAAAALFVWLSLEKMYKIVETPTGAVLGIGVVAIGIMALLYFLRR